LKNAKPGGVRGRPWSDGGDLNRKSESEKTPKLSKRKQNKDSSRPLVERRKKEPAVREGEGDVSTAAVDFKKKEAFHKRAGCLTRDQGKTKSPRGSTRNGQ